MLARAWRGVCEIVAGAALWRCRCRSRGRRSILCIWVCVCVAGVAFGSCLEGQDVGARAAGGVRNRGRRSTLAMPLPKSWQAQHSVHLGVCLCGRGSVRQLSKGTGCWRARGGGCAKSWQAQHFGDAVAEVVAGAAFCASGCVFVPHIFVWGSYFYRSSSARRVSFSSSSRPPSSSLSHSLTHSLTHSLSLTHLHSLNSHSLTHTHSRSLTLTHSHSLTHTHSHSRTHTHSLTLTHSHSLTLTHSHSVTHTHSHSLTHTFLYRLHHSSNIYLHKRTYFRPLAVKHGNQSHQGLSILLHSILTYWISCGIDPGTTYTIFYYRKVSVLFWDKMPPAVGLAPPVPPPLRGWVYGLCLGPTPPWGCGGIGLV